MLNVGPFELIFILGLPVSGILAAVYLALALRGNARRAQERPPLAPRS